MGTARVGQPARNLQTRSGPGTRIGLLARAPPSGVMTSPTRADVVAAPMSSDKPTDSSPDLADGSLARTGSILPAGAQLITQRPRGPRSASGWMQYRCPGAAHQDSGCMPVLSGQGKPTFKAPAAKAHSRQFTRCDRSRQCSRPTPIQSAAGDADDHHCPGLVAPAFSFSWRPPYCCRPSHFRRAQRPTPAAPR